MKIVLIQNIEGFGVKGDIKEVKEGYARNFLFPNGLAITENSSYAKSLLAQNKKNDENAKQDNQELLLQLKKHAEETKRIAKKVNSKGNYYATVNEKELQKLFSLEESQEKLIKWPSIKKPGEYTGLAVVGEKQVEFKIVAEIEK